MIWYIEEPARHRAERLDIDQLASQVDWLTPGEWRVDGSLRLNWDATIAVAGNTFDITLRYPNHFPHSPPMVVPRTANERWSAHQYGPGGELCLEYGPDNWHPGITGAMMLESAFRLLHGERPAEGQTAIVASRHQTTLGQDLRGNHLRLLVTRELAAIIGDIPEGVILTGKILATFRENSAVYVIREIGFPEGISWHYPLPSPLVNEGHDRPFVLIRLKPTDVLPATTDLTEFRQSLAAHGLNLPDVNYVVLLRDGTFTAFFLWPDTNSVSSATAIPAQAAMPRQSEAHAVLADRHVAIIGCGSLGSKIAAMLARAGVKTFTLVDDDILLPDNLVRNDLDWREVGAHKVDAVARRIKLVNPSSVCHPRGYKLGGQQSSGSVESLIEGLAACDLLLDCSADAKVFNYLSAVMAVGKRALLWAEVFGGGFGGLIARCRHGIEPDPASMRSAIESWCNDQGKPMKKAGPRYDLEENDTVLVADDADVTVIAAHAARLAIDTLIGATPSAFPFSVYMIGLSAGWIFDQPFDTRPIDVGGAAGQPESGPLDDAVAVEELAVIRELFRKFADASPATGTSS